MSTQKIARRVTSTENDKLLLTTGGDKTFQNVHNFAKRSKTFQKVQKRSKMFQNVQNAQKG